MHFDTRDTYPWEQILENFHPLQHQASCQLLRGVLRTAGHRDLKNIGVKRPRAAIASLAMMKTCIFAVSSAKIDSSSASPGSCEYNPLSLAFTKYSFNAKFESW